MKKSVSINKPINVSLIKIEKNVKIEAPTRKKRVGKWSLLFCKMNIGDSFGVLFENEKDATRVQNALNTSKKNYKKEDPNFNAVIRVLFKSKEVRLWRVE